MSKEKISFGDPRFKAYNAIRNFLDNYQDLGEALCDELIQNFIDKSKEILEENPLLKPKMRFKFSFDGSRYSVISEQFNTGGIPKREDYIVFASTDKESQRGRPSGSRGQGWKIWWVVCGQIKTETNVEINGNLKYYQHLVRKIDHDNKKIDWADGWAEDEQFFQKTWRENGAKITLNNVKKIYFKAAENAFRRVCVSRYNFALKKYKNIEITLEKSDGSSIEIKAPEDITTFNKSIEEFKFDEFTVPRLIDCKLRNVYIGFYDGPTLPYGWQEGIAIILRDRIVTWIKPKKKIDEGKIVGWVNADFLRDVELTTHDGFKNVSKWLKTKKHLERWLDEIEISAIEFFKGTSRDIKSKKSIALKSIGKLLSQTLGITEYGKGLSSKSKKKEETEIYIETFILKDSNTHFIFDKNANLYRNKKYLAEVGIKNGSNQDIELFFELVSTPRDFNESKKVF